MSSSRIDTIVQRVIEIAQRRGSIAPLEIKQHLLRAGYPSDLWKRVIRLARPALRREADHYVYAAPGLDRLRVRPRQQRNQGHTILKALATLVRATKAQVANQDRRAGTRFLFLRQVRVFLTPPPRLPSAKATMFAGLTTSMVADFQAAAPQPGQSAAEPAAQPRRSEILCLTRDVSKKGIRLVSGVPLPTEKVRLIFEGEGNPAANWQFTVHILWSSSIGDNLFECGGVFVEVLGTPEKAPSSTPE